MPPNPITAAPSTDRSNSKGITDRHSDLLTFATFSAARDYLPRGMKDPIHLPHAHVINHLP